MKMNFWYYVFNFFGFSIIKLGKHKYPICPECGQHTIVLWTPPKEPTDFSKLGTNEYIDWDRAGIYCCNGKANCKIQTRLKDLTTPTKAEKEREPSDG